ncbi:MAG: hypothetical protein NTW94_03260 [Legionellales bacterium]|nr:hypothetical protein [Legionellales bacterium]
MTYADRSREFSADKQRFFATIQTPETAKTHAESKNYPFLANNRILLEQEFDHMFSSLKKQGDDRQSFWLYCYYCSMMLQNHYEAYGKSSKANEYRGKSEMLRKRCAQGELPSPEQGDETLLKHLQKSIHQDLVELSTVPYHISKIRDWVAFFNIRRLHLAFSRLVVKQSVLAAQDLLWFEKLNQALGIHLDAKDMVSVINAPAPVFNVLSVALFGARLMIHASMIVKHTFFPSSKQELSLSATQRFKHEIYMRHPTMLNDLVWGTVNLLSNYAALFNIAAPVAGGLTAGFLIFDVSLLIYRRKLAEMEYLCKKEQYLKEKENHEAQLLNASLSKEDRNKHQTHCAILSEQLKQLDISRKAADATFLFNIAAAVLLLSGFTASLLIALPAAVLVSYFVCAIAVAMYVTADIYGAYHEKTLILERLQEEGGDTFEALEQFRNARQAFFISITKNTLMPLLVVTLFAVCWQAALIFTALYIGYECLQGYLKNRPEVNHMPRELVQTPVSHPG